MSRAVAASIIALQAAFCAVPAPAAAADPVPVLVHAGAERDPATSVAGLGHPGHRGAEPGPVVYARRAGGWIQYWLWFEANPQDRGILRSGRHAGDWEMVQYRLDGSEAVYAQHSGAERCPSSELERRGGRPVVYLANGSHAAYFHAGTRDRMWPDPNDEADGRGAVQRPRAVPITAASPAWMRYRGRLGRRAGGLVPARAVLPARPGLPGPRPLERPRRLGARGAAVHGAALRRASAPATEPRPRWRAARSRSSRCWALWRGGGAGGTSTALGERAVKRCAVSVRVAVELAVGHADGRANRRRRGTMSRSRSVSKARRWRPW